MSLRDPFKLALARKYLVNKSVCRNCGATNPPKAMKCRKCRSKNLRPKKTKGRNR
jgi:large subunit ribosomal protein L40e